MRFILTMRFLKKFSNALKFYSNNETANNTDDQIQQSEVKVSRSDARLVGALHWGAN